MSISRSKSKRNRKATLRAVTPPPSVHITLSGAAVQKIIDCFSSPMTAAPSTPQLSDHHLRPTLRPWIGTIDQILKQEGTVPKQFRTTAMQILKILREEHGFSGGYTTVQEYVRQARADTGQSPSRRSQNVHARSENAQASFRESSVPLSQTPTQTESSTVPLRPLRLSQHPRRISDSEETIFEWMQSIVQGKMSIEQLAEELGEIPQKELKALVSAAMKGDIRIRNKSLAVLAYSRGISASPICSFLRISQRSLFHYWKDFRAGGTEELLLRKTRSDKKASNPAIQNAVFSLLHSPPSAYGFNRTTWRLADMKAVLGDQYKEAISCDVIREIIVNAGWKWRLARRVLTSNDPDYREKVDRIKKTLAELGKDEAFFSIDEYGPFAIKKKGGLKRVAPGEQFVIPQWQKSKGYLILTAALELSTNQLIHFYSRKKNTGEMIKLAGTLRSKYRGYRTLYLSWDAASWHISKELVEHLDRVNSTAEMEGAPIIRTMPLPAGAQFLNVIESVFSGMARAIIHNSDYPSIIAATEAIDRYVEERNDHFRKHPQRAGNKIWGHERVPSFFAEEHNCKDPIYMFPQ